MCRATSVLSIQLTFVTVSTLVVLAGVFLGYFLHVEDVSPALEIRSLYSIDHHYIVMNNVIIHSYRPNTPSPVYDRESLLSLRGRKVIDPTLKAFIDRTVVLKLKPSSKRGRRGGAKVQHRIQTASRGLITRCKHRSHQTTDDYSTNQQPTMSPLIYPSVRHTPPPGHLFILACDTRRHQVTLFILACDIRRHQVTYLS